MAAMPQNIPATIHAAKTWAVNKYPVSSLIITWLVSIMRHIISNALQLQKTVIH